MERLQICFVLLCLAVLALQLINRANRQRVDKELAALRKRVRYLETLSQREDSAYWNRLIKELEGGEGGN